MELIAVPISDTDQLRETCAGMFGGDEAFIEGMSPYNSEEEQHARQDDTPVMIREGDWGEWRKESAHISLIQSNLLRPSLIDHIRMERCFLPWSRYSWK